MQVGEVQYFDHGIGYRVQGMWNNCMSGQCGCQISNKFSKNSWHRFCEMLNRSSDTRLMIQTIQLGNSCGIMWDKLGYVWDMWCKKRWHSGGSARGEAPRNHHSQPSQRGCAALRRLGVYS